MDTHIAATTQCGQYGLYTLGIEYIEEGQICRAVRRPIPQRDVFIGYGLHEDGDVSAVLRTSHDGPMSEWRWSDGAGGHVPASELRPGRAPLSPPYMHLPDEEHGYSWGEPVDIPSTKPPHYSWRGREVDEAVALAAIAAYESWLEDRAVERARSAGLFAPQS